MLNGQSRSGPVSQSISSCETRFPGRVSRYSSSARLKIKGPYRRALPKFIDPSLDLAPWRAVVPGGSVVGWFEDAGRFLVQDYPAVGEGVTRGFEDGGVCLTASKSAARILAFSEPAVESPRSK